MKTVAVSQRVDNYPERQEVRDALDQQLSRWLQRAGYLAIPVPNSLYIDMPDGTAVMSWLHAVSPAAVLLSGGNDIGQYSCRDSTEHLLLEYSRIRQVPMLGICRGMQMMAYWAGGTLHAVQGHVGSRHRLSGQIRTEVNSYHGYTLAACPEGFEILACSEDGSIEAIRHQIWPWEGWMWHPEREAVFQNHDIQRVQGLFSL